MGANRITPDQVAELIARKRAARMGPDGLWRICCVLESIRSGVEYRNERERLERSQGRRAPSKLPEEMQSLIEKLRSRAPEMVAELRARPRLTEAYRDCAEEFNDLASRLEQAVAGLPDLHSRPEPETKWHGAAAVLWWIYKKEVDPKAGCSSSGPAVRFIRGALKACGYSEIEYVTGFAIAKAIERKIDTNSFSHLCRDT